MHTYVISFQNILFWGNGRQDQVHPTTQPERNVTDDKRPPHFEEVVPVKDISPRASAGGDSSRLTAGGRDGESKQEGVKEISHPEGIQDTTAALGRLGLHPSLMEKGE